MNGVLSRIVLTLAVLALVAFGALAAVTLLGRMDAGERAAARRVLLDREAALTRVALVPGSALACLAAPAGDTVENACEARVFASPESTAAALAYVGAQLHWLADAVARNKADAGLRARLGATRRLIELDRFGLAAQVLAARDGCTPDTCAAFAWLSDTGALKSNLKARTFDQYVSRHAAVWSAPPPAVAQTPAVAPAVAPGVAEAPPPAPAVEAPSHRPVSSQYDFPSADSIPAVSIMNPEPPLPKSADAPKSPQGAGEKTPAPAPSR
jgi:hypothetical protein